MLFRSQEFLDLLYSDKVMGIDGQDGNEEIQVERIGTFVIRREGAQENSQTIARAAMHLAAAVNKHFAALAAESSTSDDFFS